LAVIKNKDILKVIGDRIQKARIEKGYTQEYVAEQIDKSIDILRSIENGRSVGSVETLLNICNILEITLDYIFIDLLDKKGEILDNNLYNDFKKLTVEQKELLNVIIKHMKKNNKNK